MLQDKNGNIPSLAPVLKGRTLVILRLKAAERVVGMVVLGLSEPLSEREKLFLKGIANPVVFAIERMRFHNDLMSKTADLNRKLDILSVLYETDKAILSTLDQGEILDRLTGC